MTDCASQPGSASRLVLDVPRLVGSKTLLRPWRVEDAPVLAAAWQDPEIAARLQVPEPSDEPAASRWISGRERAWNEGRSVDLAVTDPPSGAVIGEVGLSRLDPVRRAALIGWWIAEDWRGQGLAREAVGLVVDWALSDGPLNAVMAKISADNPASIAVAHRAGLRQVDAPGRTSGGDQGPKRLVFARLRPEAPPA